MSEPTNGAPGPAAGSAAPARDALHTLCLSDPVWAERYEGWTDLGRGGSATVVRVRSRDAEAEIAVKVFFGLTGEGRQRFGREVQNAQRLTSPYIVRTLSPFVRGSVSWIEMELVEGPDLRQELERRATMQEPLPVTAAVEIAAAVGEALRAAHAAGVVHRDVKPANVLLPKAGQPAAKLGDFGIARIVGSTRVTATGLLAGTPQFAAPEVVSGQEAVPASDVYGLALCLYLMLSGNRFPFDLPEGASPAQWLRAHAQIEPRPITAFQPALPPNLARLLALGLAKDPARRPSIEAFLALLAAHRGSTASLRAPVAVERGLPHSSWPIAVAAVAGLILGAAGLRWFLPAAVAPAARITPAPLATPLASAAATPKQTAVVAPATAPSASTPSGAAPVLAPSPTPASTPPLVRATLQNDLMTLLNVSSLTLTGLRVTLVAEDGTRCVTAVNEPMAPGEELVVALDEFDPRPASGLKPARIEVAVARVGEPSRQP